ncbi:hypothetical protein ELI_14430 [Erythrobacter litoralis HTCC2594]|uniref:Uncharacterized protein n=1 Tax=Erythrobacter litoralis (strain HTCC2594) TaxID=314225 RepID=Q2N5R3_ERYLH|nr:hypothetical protein ELI_14430 [Erythrobacter litoralis HTCC2594]
MPYSFKMIASGWLRMRPAQIAPQLMPRGESVMGKEDADPRQGAAMGGGRKTLFPV